MFKCFDCGHIMWLNERPKFCCECGKDNIMSYEEYYMEEPYEEEQEIEVEEEENE